MNINQMKCKIISRLLIVLFSIFITCTLSVIEKGVNMYKGITALASLVFVVICAMLCFKIKKQKL